MKQFIYIFLFSALIAGCNDNSATPPADLSKSGTEKAGKNSRSQIREADTLGLAEFLALKAARFRESDRVGAGNALDENELTIDTTGFAEYKRTVARTARRETETPAPREEIRMESSSTNESSNSSVIKKAPTQRPSVPKVEKKTPENSEVAQTPAGGNKEQKVEKKGTSKKAKGAIIGAATGAAAGAIINKKNRKAGGIVGGIIGAAAGYGIGRHQDKKDTSGKATTDTTKSKENF